MHHKKEKNKLINKWKRYLSIYINFLIQTKLKGNNIFLKNIKTFIFKEFLAYVSIFMTDIYLFVDYYIHKNNIFINVLQKKKKNVNVHHPTQLQVLQVIVLQAVVFQIPAIYHQMSNTFFNLPFYE